MIETHSGVVSSSERAFYEAEFANTTIVIAVSELSDTVADQVVRVGRSLTSVGTNMVLVIDTPAPLAPLVEQLPPDLSDHQIVSFDSITPDRVDAVANLWVAVTDASVLLVEASNALGLLAVTAASRLAVALGARKLVLTDAEGVGVLQLVAFADLAHPEHGFAAALATRQGGQVLPAIEAALRGGVLSVNLCRPQDLDRELFTFEGTGTLFTQGGYVRVEPLRVDDMSVVEQLIARGTREGVLRPRTRHEIARLAATGLCARVLGSDHLAGIVSLETEPYRDHSMGEVACLYAVTQFSGSGAGGLLVDALTERAADAGLDAVFAVTVSEAAGEFFLRQGFEAVSQDALPAAKWQGYDARRRSQARAYLRATG